MLLIILSPDIQCSLGIHVSLGLLKFFAEAPRPFVNLIWITEVRFRRTQTPSNNSMTLFISIPASGTPPAPHPVTQSSLLGG